MRVSSVGTSRTRSEPGAALITIVTRANEAVFDEAHEEWLLPDESRSPAKPRTKITSTGPSPIVWYAIATSPLRA